MFLVSSKFDLKIQTELAQRAYELLELPSDSAGVLLDIGCGSGLSGQGYTFFS